MGRARRSVAVPRMSLRLRPLKVNRRVRTAISRVLQPEVDPFQPMLFSASAPSSSPELSRAYLELLSDPLDARDMRHDVPGGVLFAVCLDLARQGDNAIAGGHEDVRGVNARVQIQGFRDVAAKFLVFQGECSIQNQDQMEEPA